MRIRYALFVTMLVACTPSTQGTDASPFTGDTTADAIPSDAPTEDVDNEALGDTQGQKSTCGHRVDAEVIDLGFNIVLNENGQDQTAQGKPLQEGWTLGVVATEVLDHNNREYARIASYMMPIRDALMCDIATLDEANWVTLTQILTLNEIKTEQDLSGKPPEQVYSSEGIYALLKTGEHFHPMMKFLEEAELELKCVAFKDFNFINPEGDDHCAIHALPVGQGLVLP